MIFSFASHSFFVTEKTKENEHVESQNDGLNTVSESENHDVADFEQVKTPDEVCAFYSNYNHGYHLNGTAGGFYF